MWEIKYNHRWEDIFTISGKFDTFYSVNQAGHNDRLESFIYPNIITPAGHRVTRFYRRLTKSMGAEQIIYESL